MIVSYGVLRCTVNCSTVLSSIKDLKSSLSVVLSYVVSSAVCPPLYLPLAVTTECYSAQMINYELLHMLVILSVVLFVVISFVRRAYETRLIERQSYTLSFKCPLGLFRRSFVNLALFSSVYHYNFPSYAGPNDHLTISTTIYYKGI